MQSIKSGSVFASSNHCSNAQYDCINASTLPTSGHSMTCSTVSTWIVQHGNLSLRPSQWHDISSYWWRRYSSLACKPTPEIAWALPCSACNEHLVNLLCQRHQWTYAMSHERTSVLTVTPPHIWYVALCLTSSFFLPQTCISVQEKTPPAEAGQWCSASGSLPLRLRCKRHLIAPHERAPPTSPYHPNEPPHGNTSCWRSLLHNSQESFLGCQNACCAMGFNRGEALQPGTKPPGSLSRPAQGQLSQERLCSQLIAAGELPLGPTVLLKRC